VQGKFLSDSLKIGSPVYYALSARYSKDATVLFPDSAFSFSPFERIKQTYVPTRSGPGESLDSVTYELVSFEIDSIQRLALPVFLVHGQDCTAWFATPDSVFLQSVVTAIPDSVSAARLPLKINTAYQLVSTLFNYPVALGLAGGLLVAGVVVWIIFGKKIRHYVRRRNLLRRHRQFLLQFEQHLGRLEQGFSPAQAEACLLVWKQYMEHLLRLPVTKLTSKELMQRLPDSTLRPTLSAIDQMIYARSSAWAREPFLNLKAEGEKIFQKKAGELHE